MEKENSRYKELTSHFSEEVSNEIKKYAIEEAFKFSRYIFTYKEKKQQFGYCTYCETAFETDRLRHCEKTFCPNCNSKATVQSSGMGRKYMIDNVYFVYYEKSVKDPNIIVARGIQAQRDYRYNYRDIKTKYFLKAMYVFEANKGGTMLEQSYYNNSYYERSSVFSIAGPLEQRGCRTCYSRESIEAATQNTPFQYSTWQSYDFEDMTKFFALYAKYSCIEYLTKEGFKELALDKLIGRNTYSAVSWKSTSIFKILKLNKADLKELKGCKHKDNSLFLRLYQISKKDKSNLTSKEIEEIMGDCACYFKELQSIHKYVTLRKIINYTKQQLKKCPKQFYQKSDVLIAWRDYISDCKALEMSLKDEQTLFPKDLYVAHQNTTIQVKVKTNEQFNLKIKKRANALEAYKFQHNELIIRPAESSNELIKEGELLHHCVGGYAKKYADGETNIMFIRKISEPDKPYYTLEFRKDIITQVRGKNNRSSSDDIKEFITLFTEEKLTKKKIKIQNRISITA